MVLSTTNIKMKKQQTEATRSVRVVKKFKIQRAKICGTKSWKAKARMLESILVRLNVATLTSSSAENHPSKGGKLSKRRRRRKSRGAGGSSRPPCKFFAAGRNCKGDSCPFSHLATSPQHGAVACVPADSAARAATATVVSEQESAVVRSTSESGCFNMKDFRDAIPLVSSPASRRKKTVFQV